MSVTTHEFDPYESCLEADENFPAWIGALMLLFMIVISVVSAIEDMFARKG